jgi:hypothetical protein
LLFVNVVADVPIKAVLAMATPMIPTIIRTTVTGRVSLALTLAKKALLC